MEGSKQQYPLQAVVVTFYYPGDVKKWKEKKRREAKTV
jgi:hypothetical protein